LFSAMVGKLSVGAKSRFAFRSLAICSSTSSSGDWVK